MSVSSIRSRPAFQPRSCGGARPARTALAKDILQLKSDLAMLTAQFQPGDE